MTWEGLSPPYRTIVADPPWPIEWETVGTGGRRANVTHLGYSKMSLEEIKAMPVDELADPAGCHLYLWVTAQLNRVGEGVATAEAWGFKCHDEIIWEKPNLGMGRFPRHCHEVLLVCRSGSLSLLPDVPLNVRSVQEWTQWYGRGKTHSAKPAAALDLVEQASPAPRVELFARRQRLGWDSWGNGYEGAA